MNLIKLASYFAIVLTIALFSFGESFSRGAGVLPYKIEGGTTYFLVGYNPYKKAVSDFGGDHEPSKDHDILSTAAREFNEETMFMFSAGRLPMPNLVATYQQGHLAIPHHRTIKNVIQRNTTHRLSRSGPGFDYTIFIVPIWAMPATVAPHELYTQREALDRFMPHAWRLGAEPTEFAWISKDALYYALNNTAPGHPVIVRAPSRRDPSRTFTLLQPFVGMLRHAITETGQMGLQSVMP